MLETTNEMIQRAPFLTQCCVSLDLTISIRFKSHANSPNTVRAKLQNSMKPSTYNPTKLAIERPRLEEQQQEEAKAAQRARIYSHFQLDSTLYSGRRFTKFAAHLLQTYSKLLALSPTSASRGGYPCSHDSRTYRTIAASRRTIDLDMLSRRPGVRGRRRLSALPGSL